MDSGKFGRLPVVMSLSLPIHDVPVSSSSCARKSVREKLRWDKADLISYYMLSYEYLSTIDVPFWTTNSSTFKPEQIFACALTTIVQLDHWQFCSYWLLRCHLGCWMTALVSCRYWYFMLQNLTGWGASSRRKTIEKMCGFRRRLFVLLLQ